MADKKRAKHAAGFPGQGQTPPDRSAEHQAPDLQDLRGNAFVREDIERLRNGEPGPQSAEPIVDIGGGRFAGWGSDLGIKLLQAKSDAADDNLLGNIGTALAAGLRFVTVDPVTPESGGAATAERVARTATGVATSGLLGFPLAVADAATGGNISGVVDGGVQSLTAAAHALAHGDSGALEENSRAIRRGDNGPAAQALGEIGHRGGEVAARAVLDLQSGDTARLEGAGGLVGELARFGGILGEETFARMEATVALVDAALRLASGRASAEDEEALGRAQARGEAAGEAFERGKGAWAGDFEADQAQAAKEALGLGSCTLPYRVGQDETYREDYARQCALREEALAATSGAASPLLEPEAERESAPTLEDLGLANEAPALSLDSLTTRTRLPELPEVE